MQSSPPLKSNTLFHIDNVIFPHFCTFHFLLMQRCWLSFSIEARTEGGQLSHCPDCTELFLLLHSWLYCPVSLQMTQVMERFSFSRLPYCLGLCCKELYFDLPPKSLFPSISFSPLLMIIMLYKYVQRFVTLFWTVEHLITNCSRNTIVEQRYTNWMLPEIF